MTRRRTLLAVVMLLAAGGWGLVSAVTTLREASLRAELRAMISGDPEARAAALERIRDRGEAMVPRLVAALDVAGSIPRRRKDRSEAAAEGQLLTVAVMDALAALPPERTVPALVAALDDPSSDVRHYASITLAYLGERSVPALADALARSPSMRIRTSAAWTLSLLGPLAADARPALEAALDDAHKDVRHTARYALAQVDSEAEAYWRAVDGARERQQGR